MIIGKSNISDKNYKCLIFCNRDGKMITISNSIKHICPHAFEKCKQFQTIEIEKRIKSSIDDVLNQ